MCHKVDNSLVLAGSLVGAAALTYYATRTPKPIDPFYDFDNQSIELDENDRSRICTTMKGKELISYRLEDVRTLYDILRKGFEISSNGPCFGQREGPGKGPYKWMSYSEVIEKVNQIGSGLIHKSIEPGNQTDIGIYSSNRPEWKIAEHACYLYSLKVVSLYDSYGKESIKYILNHAEIKAIFVDKFERLMNIVKNLNDLPYLKLIVVFNDLSRDELKTLDEFNSSIEIVSFRDLADIGKSNPYPHKPPKPDDIATVCYTSGTTGMPKGALISHGNIIANEAAFYERLNRPHLNYSADNPRLVHISYLPLAHMLERQSSVNIIMLGGQIGFLSGDILTLMSDVQELRPLSFPLVPRLLNRIYNEVQTQVKTNPIKRALLNRAVAVKKAEIKRGIYRTDGIYDKLIFNKIRANFGGRLCRIGTGSAPVSDEVMMFCQAAFGSPIPEGYGQTECTCALTFRHPFDPVLGHVGPPTCGSIIKLIDVPEMGYFSKNNQGEICAKGPSVFKGYLKDPEKTAEAIDQDGWLHTGDIGMWLKNGCLKIIDRKKNLFKLSQGEYISPEKIENIYTRSPLAAQVFVDGDSLKDYIVGVVVPDQDYLLKYCQKAKIDGDFEALCKNQKVKAIILKDLIEYGKAASLMPYEQVRNIYLCHVPMSLENGLTTPTMKLKRVQVRNHFKDIIAKLYAEEIPPSIVAATSKL